jgi:hypothetical protein
MSISLAMPAQERIEGGQRREMMMSPTNEIEYQMANVVKENDLHVFTIGVNTDRSVEIRFDCSMEWTGHSVDGVNCVYANGATVAEAIGKAFIDLAVKRAAKGTVPAIFGGGQ